MQHAKKCDKEALFPSEKSNRLTGQGLSERIRHYAKLAKLKKSLSFHTFRHTVATLLIQRGMPARHVQELLGHENLDTTMRYLQLSTMDLQREYRKTHPREKPI